MRHPRPGIWIEKKTVYLQIAIIFYISFSFVSLLLYCLHGQCGQKYIDFLPINSSRSRSSSCGRSLVEEKWLAASLKVKALRHHGSFHLLQSDQFFSGDPIPSLGLSYNSTHSFNYSQWALKLLKHAIFVRINDEIINAIMTRIKGSFQAFRKERVLSAKVDN